MKKFILWAAIGAALVAAAFLAFRPASTAVTAVDVKGVQQATTDGARVVDVRSISDFESGHVPGAQNVPMEQLTSVASRWDKNAPIVVYGQSKARSADAVSALEKLGFTKILHFEKGLAAWTGLLDQTTSSAVSSVTLLEQDSAASVVPSNTPSLDPTAMPVLYEFSTSWCPSCKAMKPLVDRLKQQYDGKVEFKLYDVEASAEGSALMKKFNARYVPTFVFVNKDGSVSAMKVGETSEAGMKTALDALN